MTDPYGPLPSLPGPKRQRATIPRMRLPPVFPRGPDLYQLTKTSRIPVGGPGQPPPGFVTQQQSASEWIWYWASMRVLDPERDPRQPPFYGGQLWAYQSQQLDQFVGAHSKALSTNIDFIYELSYPYLAVRIQTFRYHEATTSFKQAYDVQQQQRELGSFDEVDVFEADFLGDTTGQSAIILLKETLGLIQASKPINKGTVYPVRNPFS